MGTLTSLSPPSRPRLGLPPSLEQRAMGGGYHPYRSASGPESWLEEGKELPGGANGRHLASTPVLLLGQNLPPPKPTHMCPTNQAG